MSNREGIRPKRGTYVSRAAFTKIQMERDRLIRDIEDMVSGQPKAIPVMIKWKKHFSEIKQLNDILKEIAKKELPKLRKKYGNK